MPKNLTDADAFTDPVVVPVGTDSRDHAADDVETTAQALANRTRNLKNRLDNNELTHALLAAANLFTVGPQIVNDSSGVACLASTVLPGDVAAGNLYVPRMAFQVNGSMYVASYTGADAGAEGQLVFAVNAVWVIGTQKWQQQDVAKMSYALIVDYAGGVYISRQAAGAADWATWPPMSSSGSELSAYALNAYNVNVDHDVGVTGRVSANGNVETSSNCKATGDFQYTSAKQRTTEIPLSTFNGGAVFFATRGDDGIAVGGGDVVLAHLRLPAGAVVDQVDVIVTPAGASAMSLRAHRRTAANYATPAHSNGSVLDTASSSGTSQQVLSVNFGGLTVAENEEFWISVDGAQSGDKIWNARIYQWTDPGPINI